MRYLERKVHGGSVISLLDRYNSLSAYTNSIRKCLLGHRFLLTKGLHLIADIFSHNCTLHHSRKIRNVNSTLHFPQTNTPPNLLMVTFCFLIFQHMIDAGQVFITLLHHFFFLCSLGNVTKYAFNSQRLIVFSIDNMRTQ